MVVLIKIPFYLSLFVSFYKDCLIFKRNDFILIIFQIIILIFDQNLQSYSTPIVLITSVRRIFNRGRRKFENNEDQKKTFSTQNQSVFLPKVRSRQKKKKIFSQILSVFVLKLYAQITKVGGACRNFAYYSMLIILY